MLDDSVLLSWGEVAPIPPPSPRSSNLSITKCAFVFCAFLFLLSLPALCVEWRRRCSC